MKIVTAALVLVIPFLAGCVDPRVKFSHGLDWRSGGYEPVSDSDDPCRSVLQRLDLVEFQGGYCLDYFGRVHLSCCGVE